MYVTISLVDKAIDLAEEVGDSVSDTEDVFEECKEELFPYAPLAEPEVFGEFVSIVL